MCSNFGLNFHPGRKPAALENLWYEKLTRLYWWVRRKLFVREIERHPL